MPALSAPDTAASPKLASNVTRVTLRPASDAASKLNVPMLINGYALCEAFDRPGSKRLTIIGVTLPALTGALGFLFLWGTKNTTVWLAVPTSVFGMALLPIAAITFVDGCYPLCR
jgi:hypothetical protein